MDDAFEIRTTHVSKKDTLKIDTKLEKNMYDTFTIRMTHFGKNAQHINAHMYGMTYLNIYKKMHNI